MNRHTEKKPHELIKDLKNKEAKSNRRLSLSTYQTGKFLKNGLYLVSVREWGKKSQTLSGGT